MKISGARTFKKEVFLLRLAVTTRCILRCRYCFVLKSSKVMSEITAKKAIELSLYLPGDSKLIMFYGGEPLICFDLLKRLINFSIIMAKELKKNIFLSIATNGILLTKEKLVFFKKTGTKISISIDGGLGCHNRMRVFADGRGSFRKVYDKINLAFRELGAENVSALFGVAPSCVNQMYDNLLFLVNLGFKNINIEPIQGPHYLWGSEEKRYFLRQLHRFAKHMYESIISGKFIFLSSINRQLQNNRLSTPKRKCPFFNNLEVYPDGEITFSPFLINTGHRDRYIVGNINSNLNDKYRDCLCKLDSATCNNCWYDYYQDIRNLVVFSDIVALRDAYSIELAELIKKKASCNSIFNSYIIDAEKRVFE